MAATANPTGEPSARNRSTRTRCELAGTVREVAPEDEAGVRALYQSRYPLVGGGAGVPRAIMEALNKIRWYEFVPDDIHLIDNTLGFAHREHLSPSSRD